MECDKTVYAIIICVSCCARNVYGYIYFIPNKIQITAATTTTTIVRMLPAMFHYYAIDFEYVYRAFLTWNWTKWKLTMSRKNEIERYTHTKKNYPIFSTLYFVFIMKLFRTAMPTKKSACINEKWGTHGIYFTMKWISECYTSLLECYSDHVQQTNNWIKKKNAVALADVTNVVTRFSCLFFFIVDCESTICTSTTSERQTKRQRSEVKFSILMHAIILISRKFHCSRKMLFPFFFCYKFSHSWIDDDSLSFSLDLFENT